MSLEQAFSYAMSKLNIKPTQRIAVAVSGGADSLALTLLANEWAKKEITAITVDHALRSESKHEAEQVGRWLKNYNINHYTLTWEGDKKSSNIQAEARAARYSILIQFCKANNINSILVAHTKDDQAETVLMRLMRGSGVDGLSAIHDEIKSNGISIVRPLLDITKEDLKSYLRAQKQGWIEDPSNQNEKFARVGVRNFIGQSDNPTLLVDRLVETAKNMQRSRSYIESKIAEEMAQVAHIRPEGYCLLDIGKFKSLHEESALKILSRLIKNIGGQYYKPRFEKLENLYKSILSDEYSATLGGCEIYPSEKKSEQGKLVIIREAAAIDTEYLITPESSIIWDGRFECKIKNASGFFTVGAIGKQGFEELAAKNKKFRDINLPKKVIYSLPCLKTLENIVAAPHIGYYSEEGLEGFFEAELVF